MIKSIRQRIDSTYLAHITVGRIGQAPVDNLSVLHR